MKDAILKECEKKMEKTIHVLEEELHGVRTGRASASILDNVTVDYYGQPTPITQVASVSVPEPRLITVSPWDASIIGDIEKAIISSDLGLNPGNDGKVIRIPVPALSEERRKEFVKVAKKYGEQAKVAIRNIRREENEKLKKMKKDGELPEDLEKKLLDEVQKLTDEFVKRIDDIVAKKEADILEV